MDALDALAEATEQATQTHIERRERIEAQLMHRQAQSGMLAETLGVFMVDAALSPEVQARFWVKVNKDSPN